MSSPPAEPHRRADPGDVAAVLLLGALFGFLALRSWRRIGDPMVDFGREVYMAWRLSEGDALGVDVTPLFGPLSFLLNARLWNLGDMALTPILIANLCVAALATGCLFLTARQVFRATVSGLLAAIFLTTFAFAQLRPFGSFNFATPYAHAASHGALFTYASLACLVAYVRRPGTLRLAAGAASAGVTWLLKPELAVATTVGLVAALVCVDRVDRRRDAPAVLLLLLPCAAYLLTAAVAGSWATGAQQLVQPWVFGFRATPGADGYFALVSGFDAPLRNLTTGFLLALTFVASVAGLAVLDHALAGTPSPVRMTVGLVAVVAAFAPLFVTSAWLGLGPALPILLLLGIGSLLVERRRQRHRPDADAASRNAAFLVWAALSLALLARMMLRTRLDHYGFYLAGPGLLLVLGLLVDEIPRRISRRTGAGGSIVALAGLGVGAAVLLGSVRITGHWLERKTRVLGSDGDRVHVLGPDVDPRPGPVADAIRIARTRTGAEESVLVIPEGGIVNYLARRRSPIAASTVLPPEIAAFGEGEMLRQLRDDPPAVVFLSPLPLADYGDHAPGESPGFGPDIVRWVSERYSRVESLAARTSRGVTYELVVLAPAAPPGKR